MTVQEMAVYAKEQEAKIVEDIIEDIKRDIKNKGSKFVEYTTLTDEQQTLLTELGYTITFEKESNVYAISGW